MDHGEQVVTLEAASGEFSLGTVTRGLEFHTMSAWTPARRDGSVSASPRRLMFSSAVRCAPASRSVRKRAASSTRS